MTELDPNLVTLQRKPADDVRAYCVACVGKRHLLP